MTQERLGELLSAYLDGELESREQAFVEHLLVESAAARLLLEELRRNLHLVALLPHHAAPTSLAIELRQQIERRELLSKPDRSPVAGRKRRAPLVALLSVAAAVVVTTVISLWYADGTLKERGSGKDEHVVATAAKEFKSPQENVRTRSAVARTPVNGSGARTETAAPAAVAVSIDGTVTSEMVQAFQYAIQESLVTAIVPLVDPPAVRTASFSAEPVRLELVVNSAAEREGFMTGLIARQSEHGAIDLEKLDAAMPAAGFLYRGQPGINFAEVDQGQMLVRIPLRQLGMLVDDVAASPEGDTTMSLIAGSAVLHGAVAAREMARRLTPSEPLPTGRRLGGEGLLGGLLGAMGFDPGVFLSNAKSSDKDAMIHDDAAPTAEMGKAADVTSKPAAEPSTNMLSKKRESLVERRSRALLVPHEGSDLNDSATPGAHMPEPYLTLVVQVRVVSPTQPAVKPARVPPTSGPKPVGRPIER